MKKLYYLLISILIINLSQAQYTKLFDLERDITGGYPYDSFISDGTYLYGMTHLGGTYDGGTIFKIKPDGSNFIKIFDFNDTLSGRFPNGSFYYDGVYLFGTTVGGGANSRGTIFKIKPDGSSYVKLLDFDGLNGWGPSGTLISDGTYLYGITGMGGANGDGIVYKIKPDGSGFLNLMDFERYTSGFSPHGSLISDSTYLYGMTMSGGITATAIEGGDGTIFKIKTDGTGYEKLLDFTGTNGSYPFGSFIYDGTFLYGMTRQGDIQGNVFKIKPDGSGFVNLLSFNGNTNGAVPHGSLIFFDSFLYGLTWGGGISNYGTIFKIKPDGSSYTKLWDFINEIEGRNPYSTLFSDSTFLYGMTYSGGINGDGIIFKFNPNETGLRKIKENEKITIYPNPTTGLITVQAEGIENVEVINIEGKQVYTGKETEIDLSNQPKGIYIIKVINDKLTITRKLIKQ